jgi:hypothetical protein
MADILNAQIDSIDAEITRLNGEIDDLTACLTDVPDPSELCTCICTRKTNLMNTVTSLENTKTEFQAKLALFTTGWGTERQAMVDEINTNYPNTYNYQLNELLRQNDTDRQTEFFTLYSQATTTFLKGIVLKQFFNQ